MSNEIEISLYVLVLAVPLGLELVRRVSPLLHTCAVPSKSRTA